MRSRPADRVDRREEGPLEGQSAGVVDGLARFSGREVFDGGDFVGLDADVGAAAIGECAAFDDEVEHGLLVCLIWPGEGRGGKRQRDTRSLLVVFWRGEPREKTRSGVSTQP